MKRLRCDIINKPRIKLSSRYSHNLLDAYDDVKHQVENEVNNYMSNMIFDMQTNGKAA